MKLNLQEKLLVSLSLFTRLDFIQNFIFNRPASDRDAELYPIYAKQVFSIIELAKKVDHWTDEDQAKYSKLIIEAKRYCG